ncbi:uncharacterized protein LOC143286487 [Babylonia areolata]|uniref:uncharacterized protein LOC143286487 n=1 Tax=Babylonia areolata TaxID=304850 RepID=UPI003FD14962
MGHHHHHGAGGAGMLFGGHYPHHQGHLDPGFSDNATLVPCPGSCVCTERGLRVDCSGQNLTRVPREIPAGTTHLDLSMNNISTLPDNAFAHLTSLQDLRLASNKLQSLPKRIFRKNRFLSTLYLQGNRFKSVPRGALQNLPQLQQLHLDANQIREVPANCFKNLHSLKQLWLDYNNLTRVPSRALSSLTHLEALTLALNNITVISDHAFRNLSRLVVLLLHDNRIRHIGDYAFLGLKSLRILELNKNRLKEMPSSLSHLESLSELNLEENNIETLPDNSFSQNRKLTLIQLLKNPIRSIGSRAFVRLPSLEKIVLSEVTNMFSFPDLNGTNNLTQIRLDRASIRHVPSTICTTRPRLKFFDIHSNKITTIPDLKACSVLINLNLGNNQILALQGKPFQGLSQLRDLTLSDNKIKEIPADAFIGLSKLQYLDLAHNQIKVIDPSAFRPLSSLEDLNVGDNQISTLPTQGLKNLRKLQTFDIETLRDFPPKEAFPKVYSLVLNYAYHCCDFLQSASIPTDTVEMDEQVTWLAKKDGAPDMWQEHYYNLTEFWTTHFDNHTSELWEDIQNDEYDPDSYDFSREAELYLEDYERGHGDVYIKNLVMANPPLTCKPKPGPFMPCDDLFGWWSLRCGVWFVFLLALLGNAVVLFVSVSSRSKMDVPRFLICNLACADFFMGVYLGILAMVDASTLGEFRKYAIQWQISGGCLVAGFLGVLSSELSVFTLTVITLERFYVITHAMQLNKRLSLRQAGYIMLGGWLWTIALASLPLFGISDYRKFAICLPFEVEDLISKSYVCFILIFNGVCFCIILTCYLCMYLSIRHSQAWNSNDTRVAKRMALLVFTDFLCWAPIAFFSLGASFGKNLIDLSGAKVLTIFVLPLNSCTNPFLYAIFTKQFKRDCVLLCRRLEDSSIARHFSRVSNRHVSFSWGSSRRPSQLHSLVNGEKVGSCSHSVSAASAGGVGGGGVFRNGGGGGGGCGGGGGGGSLSYHSDPDSGKGSLDYEKMPCSDTPPTTQREAHCHCHHHHHQHLTHNNNKDELLDHGARDYDDDDTTNAYNDMLSRCHVQCRSSPSSSPTPTPTRTDKDSCSWGQCRDCRVIMHHVHDGYNPAGGGGGGERSRRLGSYDYNCTGETYLPNSDVEHDMPDYGGSGCVHGCRHHHQHSHSNNQHRGSSNGRSPRNRRETDAGGCKKSGCECRKEKSYRTGGGGGGRGEKRCRQELVLPVVSYSKGDGDHVSIHSNHNGLDLPPHCCHGGGGGGGEGGGCWGGTLRCCSSSSSPMENGDGGGGKGYGEVQDVQVHGGGKTSSPSPSSSSSSSSPSTAARRQARPPSIPPTRIMVTQHGEDRPASLQRYICNGTSRAYLVTRDTSPLTKADDADSGHGLAVDASSAGRGDSSIDDGVAEMGGGSGEMDEDQEDEESSVEEGADLHRGDSLRVQGHLQRGPVSPGHRVTTSPAGVVVCPRALDKSEHMRFFTDSLAAHPHACRSNSLVELTQATQAKLTARLDSNPAPKRLSLTPRQEGYLLLNTEDGSPYSDQEEDPEFPPYEELQHYLHASKQHAKGRALASDRGSARRDEVCGLLGDAAHSPSHTTNAGKHAGKMTYSGYDKESGIRSEY